VSSASITTPANAICRLRTSFLKKLRKAPVTLFLSREINR
jgi:hypothetical protein